MNSQVKKKKKMSKGFTFLIHFWRDYAKRSWTRNI